MASERQIVANRKNANRSTGPKTPSGKSEIASQCAFPWPLAVDLGRSLGLKSVCRAIMNAARQNGVDFETNDIARAKLQLWGTVPFGMGSWPQCWNLQMPNLSNASGPGALRARGLCKAETGLRFNTEPAGYAAADNTKLIETTGVGAINELLGLSYSVVAIFVFYSFWLASPRRWR